MVARCPPEKPWARKLGRGSGVSSPCRFIKKLEHTWKALVHDGVSIEHRHPFVSPQT